MPSMEGTTVRERGGGFDYCSYTTCKGLQYACVSHLCGNRFERKARRSALLSPAPPLFDGASDAF
jgi:hypothetical protein